MHCFFMAEPFSGKFPNLSAALQAEMKARFDLLNSGTEALIAKLKENAERFGISKKKSGIHGEGMFTKKGIPPNTVVLVHMAAYTMSEYHITTLGYVYSDTITCLDGVKINIFMDGKPMIDALRADGSDDSKMMQRINGGMVNHGCYPNTNLVAKVVTEETSGLNYIVLETKVILLLVFLYDDCTRTLLLLLLLLLNLLSLL